MASSPLFQTRHLNFIAATIAQIPNNYARIEATRIFAAELRDTNSKFDEARFIKACLVEFNP